MQGKPRQGGKVGRREQNEKRFPEWEELPTGGRRYRRRVPGRAGWMAVYVKEVDAEETTTRFWQEVWDDQGVCREVHEKYPLDLGHRKA